MSANAPQPTGKRPWSPLGLGMPQVPKEDRQLHAAEHIALYLDRIDSHLERIAKALEENSKINSLSYDQLVQIKTALMTKLR